MHSTISFHAPGGYCGYYSDSLPRIYDSSVDEYNVRFKCRLSSGCIGYAYDRYSAISYIYFSSFDAADKAADFHWGMLSGSCFSSCTINEYGSNSYYTCHRKTQTTTTEPRQSTITTTTGVCVCVCAYLYHSMGREGDRKWVLNFVNVHRMNVTKQRVYDYTLVLVVVGVAIMS